MPRPLWNEKSLSAVVTQDLAAVLPQIETVKASYITVYAVFGAGTGAGTIVVECAHDPAYTGTWANLATLAWAAATSVKSATVVGSHLAVRVRVSVAVTGGTVDVWSTISG